MNPLKYLSPALFTRLSNALALGGDAVPVYEHLPTNEAGHYVLLQQPTHAPQAGGTGCKAWTCTALVDVITQFRPGQVSSGPADELLDQVTDLLEDRRLVLPPGWECGAATFEPSLELRELGDESVAVRRLLRFRWQVYYHPGAAVVPGPPATVGFPYLLPFLFTSA